MIPIPKTSTAWPIRWEMDAPPASTVTLGVYGYGGTVLLAASTAATVFAPAALASNAALGATSISLTITPATGTDPVPGDRLRILGANSSALYEDVEVQTYNTTSDVATLRFALNNAHASGATVKGLFARYSLNVTTLSPAVSLGDEITVVWQDTGTLKHHSQTYRITDNQTSDNALATRFRRMYPQTYALCEDRFDEIVIATEARFRAAVASLGHRLEDIRDSEYLEQPRLALARVVALLDSGDNYELERAVAAEDWTAQYDLLKGTRLWFDIDQDKDHDDEEITAAGSWRFSRGL